MKIYKGNIYTILHQMKCFSYDLKSTYKSVWIGWWLITWCDFPRKFSEFSIVFRPYGD